MEGLLEVANEVRIPAEGLARAVGNLGDRAAVALHQLEHDVHRADAGQIAGELGADAEAGVDAAAEVAQQLDGLVEVEPVGEDQRLLGRVDAEPLIVADGLLAPYHGIAGVVAQPLVAARQLEVEVTQESIHGDAVGERDTEVVGEFVQPASEGGALAELQREAELLVGLEPLVGLGAHRGQPVFLGQQVVAGAAKRRQPLLEATHHGVLYREGEAATGAEVDEVELAHLLPAQLPFQLVDLLIEPLQCLADAELGIAEAVAHLADDGEHRDLPQDHVLPGAFDAHIDATILLEHLEQGGVQRFAAQVVQVVGREEGAFGQEVEFGPGQAQGAGEAQLFLDLAHHGQQIFFVAAVELGDDVGIRIAMEHRLLHVQLVGIGVEQAVEDGRHIRHPAGVECRLGSGPARRRPRSSGCGPGRLSRGRCRGRRRGGR